jgi:FKBP-type peptidyl-prolyl cis-trans isomerase FkpA
MRRALILTTFVLGACSEKPAPSSAATTKAASTIETATFAPALGVDIAASTKTPTGVYYRDLVTGGGPAVANGQQVAMRYTGWLPDGTKFDGNEPAGDPYTFVLGTRAVIDGWDHGIVGMKVGGRRQLIIPPALGYGTSGNGPIPPNAILVFNVQLMGAQ